MNDIVVANAMETMENGAMWTSFKVETMEEKKKFYNAISQKGISLSEHVNETFNLKDVYIEVVDMINKKTGEAKATPRIVLWDDKGNTYNTASFGIYNSLKRIFQIFDVPSTWESPLKVKIKQIKKDENSILNLEIV